MSIFSRMKKSRQEAKQHNAKLADQEKKEQLKTPYKHVPTHAATDAIASAPPSWRESDRQRIQEENRRRSAMAASGHHMNMPGIPRVGSSLSHVSYPSDMGANPKVRLPRAYSYNGVSPYHANHSRDVLYSLPDVTPHYVTSSKGKEAVRRTSYETPRISPSSSKDSGSSSGSTSSQDDLEMQPVRLPAKRPATADLALRVHPSNRRISDSSIDRIAMANSAKGAAISNGRDVRPPTSMRGFSSITPVVNTSSARTRSSSPGGALNSGQNSSETTLNDTAAYGPQTVDFVERSSRTSRSRDTASPVQPAGIVSTLSGLKSFKERKTPKTTRFSELERIESNVETPTEQRNSSAYISQIPVAKAAVVEPVIVNVFPEEDSVPEPEQAKKSKRFSKTGGRLMRKHRWASSKATAVAV